MKKTLRLEDVYEALPAGTGRLLSQTVEAAVALDQPLYLVGGPVRDLLLGRPLKDLDLMTPGQAGVLAARVAEQTEGLRITEHPRFGTVALETEEGALDLATLRHETYAAPGALPDVVPGTLDQDIARRDFSVNALCCRIETGSPKTSLAIIDRVGGLEDLGKKRLRVLHDRSFHDDPTRIWRAARFASRLGFSLDRKSRSVLRDALRDGSFGSVSGERFRRELVATFDEAHAGTHPGRVLRLLSDWHVLGALEPGLALGRDRMSPLRKLGKAIAEPEWPAPRWRPAIAGLSIWLAPLPAALRRRTLERFSIRGDQATRIVQFGRDAERLQKTLARTRGRGAVDALLTDKTEETVQALYALADPAVRRRILRWGAEDRRRRAPVTGADLVETGLAGPEIGRALARIRAGFLDGEIANREEALALAQEMGRRALAKAKPKRPRKASSSRRKAARPKSGNKSGKGAPKVASDRPIPDTES